MTTRSHHILSMTYGFLGAATFGAIAYCGPATAQVQGSLPAFLKLQAITPGTQQSGHANVSGTVQAGQFVGGGTGLTGVNADLIDGLDSTAFLTSLPNPMTLSGNQSVSHIIKAINSASASDSVGVYGVATAASGGTIGVRGDSSSTTGLGLYGRVYSATGQNFGVWGQSPSTSGTGVFGLGTATAGTNYGVFGKTESGSGYGVYGLNTSHSSVPIAILGESIDSLGTGVRGIGGSIGVFGTGANNGLRGDASGSNKTGVLGNSTATSGIGAGVEGSSSSPIGYGVWSSGDLHVSGDMLVTGSKSGYVSDIVLNVGNEPLECGDVVEIVGNDTAVVGDIPVITVRKARTASSSAVLGPVDCALQLQPQANSDQEAKLPTRLRYSTQQFHVHKTDGSISPGGYGRVVTLGSYKAVRVDASFGAVKPGDLLVSSPRAGYAMRSDNPKTGTVIGKALGGLQSGAGTIPVLVQSR